MPSFKLLRWQPERRWKLKDTGNSIIESTKLSTLLLQVAEEQSNVRQHVVKSLSFINPIDETYEPHPWEPVISSTPSQTLAFRTFFVIWVRAHLSSLLVGAALATLWHHQTVTSNRTGSGKSPPISSLTPLNPVTLCPNIVPEFSNSSSKDKFYDADEFNQNDSSSNCLIDSSGSAFIFRHSHSGNSLQHSDNSKSLNFSMNKRTNYGVLFLFIWQQKWKWVSRANGGTQTIMPKRGSEWTLGRELFQHLFFKENVL